MNQMTAIGSGLSAQDERAISAILVAYGTSIDQRDWNRFRTCFQRIARRTMAALANGKAR